MEQLGEAQARKHMKADGPEGPTGPEELTEVHRADVEHAADELQQSADLAMKIAKHPSHFHDLVGQTEDNGLGESDDIAQLERQYSVPQKEAHQDAKQEAEAKLSAAETAVRSYGIGKAERKAEKQEEMKKETTGTQPTAAGKATDAKGKAPKADSKTNQSGK